MPSTSIDFARGVRATVGGGTDPLTSRPSTQEKVERILAKHAGSPVRVIGSEELATGRGLVERLTCSDSIPGIGSTVIVKRRDLPGFDETNLATEAAALDLVDDVCFDVAPRLLGGGAEDGLIVMTDLGQQTLESVLFGADPATARAALLATGELLARLHAVPVDEVRFSGIPTWTLTSRDSEWALVHRSLHELGLPPVPRAAEHEQQLLAATLASPGESTSMCHGDLTPNNVVVGADGRCRLIDFEGAGPQHVGVDLCMLRFPFAWYGRWALVPADARSAMEQAYRNSVDAPADDLDRRLAVGCMSMALLRLERLPRIADPDQALDVAFRRRVQIASTIEVTIETCAAAEEYPSLIAWLALLLDAIRERWAEASQPPPVFPAFR